MMLTTEQAAGMVILDRETVEIILTTCESPAVHHAAQEWLFGYGVARSLGFGERVALKQAAQRWDLALTAPLVLHPAASLQAGAPMG